MSYILDFLRLEFTRAARNIFLWIAQIIVFLSISKEISHYVGKQRYLLSELIQSGTLTLSQELMAKAVIFTLSTMLLISIFVFANYFKMFMDNRYWETTLGKSIKTSKLVFFKLTPAFSAVILINFVATFVSAWICLKLYNLVFEPGYFSSLYLIYSVIPLFFWLVLSFAIAVLVSDVKIFYPLMFLMWFINIFESKYSLGYIHWTKLNLQNPLGDIGLLTNRLAYLILAVVLLIVGIKLLEEKRKDIFKSKVSREARPDDGTSTYRFKDSKITALLTSYKINLSWKCIFGIIVFAVLPPLLNQIIPPMFDGMLSTSEIVMRVLRSGEIYLSLAVLLYASYGLNIEGFYNTSEIIVSKPGGVGKVYRDKLQVFFVFTMVMAATFYFSIILFVDGLSIASYAKIILPEIILYLILPFAAVALIKHRVTALAICYLLWAVNLICGMRLPIYLNTFAPIQFMNTIGYNINRIELIAASLILLVLFYFKE